MADINYYLTKLHFEEDSPYYATVSRKGKVSIKDMADSLATRNTTLAKSDILAVLSLLEDITMEHLLDGKTVTIDNFLSINTRVKGGFESEEDVYSPARHNLGFNVKIDNNFLKQFTNRANLIKQPNERDESKIQKIFYGMEKLNRLHRRNPATIKGERLLFNDHRINELTLINNADRTQRVTVSKDMIFIDSYTTGFFKFNFNNAFTTPEWLVDGLAISIVLTITNEEDGNFIYTNSFETEWSDN